MTSICHVFPLVLFLALAPLPSLAAEPGTRTFDQLTPAELDQVSQITRNYYMCVSDKTETIGGADKSTPERILATYPPYIHIIRQQCRISLLNVEKQLYAMRLNPEFVTNYVTTLREDVLHFALQQVLKKKAEEKEEAKANEEWEKRSRPKDAEEKTGQPARQGFGIFSPQKPGEQNSKPAEQKP